MSDIQSHIAEDLSLRAVVKTKKEQWDPSTSKNPALNETLEVPASQIYTQPETSSITTYLHFSFQAVTTVSLLHVHLFSGDHVFLEQVTSKHDIHMCCSIQH